MRYIFSKKLRVHIMSLRRFKLIPTYFIFSPFLKSFQFQAAISLLSGRLMCWKISFYILLHHYASLIRSLGLRIPLAEAIRLKDCRG